MNTPVVQVGDTVAVMDEVHGRVTGTVVKFNHEGYPLVRFADGTVVVVFPDMMI